MNAHTLRFCTTVAVGALITAGLSLSSPAQESDEATALGETTNEPPGAAPSREREVTPEQELLRAGIPATVAALSAALQDRGMDPELRALSALALGNMQDRAVLPLLLAALDDPEERVRTSALAALYAVPDPRSVPRLKAILDDESTRGIDSGIDWRVNAVGALGLIRREEATAVILRTALDPLEAVNVRYNALVRLGQWGRPVASTDLRPLLSEAMPEMRVAAAAAMARMGDRTSIPTLASAVLDPANPDYLRTDAVTALTELTDERFGYDMREHGVPGPGDWPEIAARVDAWWQANRRYYE